MFNKLKLGGNYYAWEAEVKVYFESIGLWAHVTEDAEIEVGEDYNEDEDMLSAKCKRVLLHSLDAQVLPAIRHLESPNQMYLRLKTLFVGTPAARVRSLRYKLNRIRFNEGGYFGYLTEFSNAVYQLNAEDGVLSWKDIAFCFLKGLPRMLSATTQPLLRNVENAADDVQNVWTETYDAVLEYCIDTGLYNLKAVETYETHDRTMTGQANFSAERTDKKKTVQRSGRRKGTRCWGCGKFGHVKKDSLLRKENVNGNQVTDRPWSAMTLFKPESARSKERSISGASGHCCGNLEFLNVEVAVCTRKKKSRRLMVRL